MTSPFSPAAKACVWTAFASVMFASLLGNSLVVWIILAHAKMRSSTNIFLLSLSLSDLLFNLLQVVPNVANAVGNGWSFGYYYCALSNFMTTFSISLCVFIFMAIAIERYLVIVHPLRPRPKRVSVLCSVIFIWLVSILSAAPSAAFSKIVEQNASQTCQIEKGLNDVLNPLLFTLQYLMPLVVVCCVYVTIGTKLWRHRPIGERPQGQEESVRAKRKVVLMMITVVTIFALCWLPYQLSFFIMHLFSVEMFVGVYFLAACSTVSNPIIYCSMNRNFRLGFQWAFRWLPCVPVVDRDRYAELRHGRAKAKAVATAAAAATSAGASAGGGKSEPELRLMQRDQQLRLLESAGEVEVEPESVEFDGVRV